MARMLNYRKNTADAGFDKPEDMVTCEREALMYATETFLKIADTKRHRRPEYATRFLECGVRGAVAVLKFLEPGSNVCFPLLQSFADGEASLDQFVQDMELWASYIAPVDEMLTAKRSPAPEWTAELAPTNIREKDSEAYALLCLVEGAVTALHNYYMLPRMVCEETKRRLEGMPAATLPYVPFFEPDDETIPHRAFFTPRLIEHGGDYFEYLGSNPVLRRKSRYKVELSERRFLEKLHAELSP